MYVSLPSCSVVLNEIMKPLSSVVIRCTTRLNIKKKNSSFCELSVVIRTCYAQLSEHLAIISLYFVNLLVPVTEIE